MSTAFKILEFWLGDDKEQPLKNAARWWKPDPAFDLEVKRLFEADWITACEGRYDSWKRRSSTCLAYIILLDQFSRNIYRNTPRAFAQDPLALQASLEGQRNKLDAELAPVERWFFYMPMMHSEKLEIQKLSVAVFAKLAEEAPSDLGEALAGAHDFARRHYEIIARFGRFPHRNLILNRRSLPEEIEFLKQPGSSF